MNLQLVIVPQWVERAVKKAGMGESSYTSLHDLTNILSKGDVAFYALLNMHLWEVIHPAVAKTFTPFDFHGTVYGNQDEEKEKKFSSEDFMRLFEKASLENPEPTLRALYEDDPVSLPPEMLEEYFTQTRLHGYEVRAVADNVMAYFIREEPAIIKAMTDNARVAAFEAVRAQRKAVTNTLKTLLTYLSFEGVCKTPMFTHFTQLARLGVEG